MLVYIIISDWTDIDKHIDTHFLVSNASLDQGHPDLEFSRKSQSSLKKKKNSNFSRKIMPCFYFEKFLHLLYQRGYIELWLILNYIYNIIKKRVKIVE